MKLPILLLALATGIFARGNCGTAMIQTERPKVQTAAYVSASKLCDPDLLYDTVLTRTTAHFAIFYTDSGLHAASAAFIDSLALALEAAYSLHTKTHKTLAPKGASTTPHYEMEVPSSLYPVEVLDIFHLRNTNSLFGGYCTGCWGGTIADQETDEASVIIFDNDFKYPAGSEDLKTLETDSGSCNYYEASAEISNGFYGYSYAENFGPGVRITAYHELYHAVQFRYHSFDNSNYWFEASASGQEDIGAPDVNDYLTFISSFTNMTWTSFAGISNEYSLAALFLAMYETFGPQFDTKLWEAFKGSDDLAFEEAFAKVVEGNDLDADSVFQAFAERLFFAGTRSSSRGDIDSVYTDHELWPNVGVFSEERALEEKFPYIAYRRTLAYPEVTVPGRVSYLVKNSGDSVYSKVQVASEADYRAAYATLESADSVVLVFTRLRETASSADTSGSTKFYAYPNPWRGTGALCFANIPSGKSVIEIRNRKGNLVHTERYDSEAHCIDEATLRAKLAPGLYFFRAGRNGKTKKLILIHSSRR